MLDVEILTAKQLWQKLAPAFNFELDENQLLKRGLYTGFVVKVGQDEYQITGNYDEAFYSTDKCKIN